MSTGDDANRLAAEARARVLFRRPPNGRPGQYDAATFMQDTRLPCTAKDQYDELSIDCGAKIERWASNKDAKARAADIQQKLKDFGLGAEYDYVP